MLDLREVCATFGVHARSIEIPVDEIGSLPVPCLAHLRMGHFVLIDAVDDDLVKVIDPAVGELSLHVTEFVQGWDGAVVVITDRRVTVSTRGREVPPELQGSTRNALYRLLRMLVPYWSWVLGTGALMFFNAGVAVGIPVALMMLIDQTVQNQNVVGLSRMIGFLAGMTLAQAVFRLSSGMVYNMVSNALLYDMRVKILAKIERLELENIAKLNTGDLLARLMNDTAYAQSFIVNFGFNFILNVVSLIVIAVIVVYLNPHLGLIGLSPLPLFGVVFWWVFAALQTRSRRLHEENARVMGQAQRVITGLESIKAYGRGDVELSLFRDRLGEAWRAAFSVDTVQQSAGAFLTLVTSTGPILVLWYGGIGVINSAWTLGTVVGISVLAGRLLEPALQLAQQQSQWQVAGAAAARYFEVLDVTTSVQESEFPQALPAMHGGIELKDVTVNYGHGNVLESVSLSVTKGSTVALIGPNGGGKSTLVQLLLRFIDPVKGQVLIDGQDLKELRLHSLRSQIALVNQHPLILEGTVLDNIRYGRLHATESEIMDAANVSGFDDVVATLPVGYQTNLVRNGGNLSAGQRQKLALARALVRRPVLLILDEATSSLDVQAEDKVYRRIREYLPGSTILIAAHRPWVTVHATKLVYIDKGRLMSEGSHQDLLRECTPYRRMCEIAGLVPASTAVGGRLVRPTSLPGEGG